MFRYISIRALRVVKVQLNALTASFIPQPGFAASRASTSVGEGGDVVFPSLYKTDDSTAKHTPIRRVSKAAFALCDGKGRRRERAGRFVAPAKLFLCEIRVTARRRGMDGEYRPRSSGRSKLLRTSS